MMQEGWNLEYNGATACLTIHRPARLNALNISLLEQLHQLLIEIENHAEVRALLVTGSGEKAFIAGADIDQMSSMTSSEAHRLIKAGHRAFSKLESLSIPTIAAVNGYAVGGGLELALCTDFRICSENARFGLPEIKLGVIAGWGGPCRLARLIGPGRAKDLYFRGRLIGPEEAHASGLVTQVHASIPELGIAARHLADELAAKPSLTLRLDKKIIDDHVRGGLGIQPERDALALGYLLTTTDTQEGLAAFLEKRTPEFKGK